MPRPARNDGKERPEYWDRFDRWIIWWRDRIPEEAVLQDSPPTPPWVTREHSLLPDDSASLFASSPPPSPPPRDKRVVDIDPDEEPAPPVAPPTVPGTAPAPPPQQIQEDGVVDVSSETTVVDITDTSIVDINTTVLDISDDEPAPIEPAGGTTGMGSSGGLGAASQNRAETVIPENVPPSPR